MSTTSDQHTVRPSGSTDDATFIALMARAFATSFITEADELMSGADNACAGDDRDLVPAYVPRQARGR